MGIEIIILYNVIGYLFELRNVILMLFAVEIVNNIFKILKYIIVL